MAIYEEEGAVSSKKFIVCREGVSVEVFASKTRAERAVIDHNEHEKKKGRPQTYTITAVEKSNNRRASGPSW